MTSSLRTKIKRYDSLDEMKADEYRYWQQQPDHVRLTATFELSREAYALKATPADAARLQRPLVQLER